MSGFTFAAEAAAAKDWGIHVVRAAKPAEVAIPSKQDVEAEAKVKGMAVGRQGGLVFQVTDLTRLFRWWAMGGSTPFYDTTQGIDEKVSFGLVKMLLGGQGGVILDSIIKFDADNTIKDRTRMIQSLAVVCRLAEPEVIARGLQVAPSILRTLAVQATFFNTYIAAGAGFARHRKTHKLTYVEPGAKVEDEDLVVLGKGFGRQARRELSMLYLGRNGKPAPASQVMLGLTKYLERDNFSHFDGMNFVHPNPKSATTQAKGAKGGCSAAAFELLFAYKRYTDPHQREKSTKAVKTRRMECVAAAMPTEIVLDAWKQEREMAAFSLLIPEFAALWCAGSGISDDYSEDLHDTVQKLTALELVRCDPATISPTAVVFKSLLASKGKYSTLENSASTVALLHTIRVSLAREHLHTAYLSLNQDAGRAREVWYALLFGGWGMPATALVRNLGVMSQNIDDKGVLVNHKTESVLARLKARERALLEDAFEKITRNQPYDWDPIGAALSQYCVAGITAEDIHEEMKATAAVAFVEERLSAPNFVCQSRLSPFHMLIAHRTYGMGKSLRGSTMWSTHPRIVRALETGFYESFKYVPDLVCPNGKPCVALLCQDVSPSMRGYGVFGLPESHFSAHDVACTLSMVMLRCWKTRVVGFGHNLVDMKSRLQGTLEEVAKNCTGMIWGKTNMYLAVQKAQIMDADCVLCVTDNDVGYSYATCNELVEQIRAKKPWFTTITITTSTSDSHVFDPEDPRNLLLHQGNLHAGFMGDVRTHVAGKLWWGV